MVRQTLVSLFVIAILVTGSSTLTSTAQKRKRAIAILDAQQEQLDQNRAPESQPIPPAVRVTPTPQPEPTPPPTATRTLTINANQLSSLVLDSPADNEAITVANQANSPADVDLVAIDIDGNEVGRDSVLVNASQTLSISLQNVFPGLLIGSLSSVSVQASARTAETARASKDSSAAVFISGTVQLSIAFFSQRDARWSSNKLGTCSSTIGSEGCAITSVAMAGARSVYNFNPATLNSYLTKNGGYSSGCLINWGIAATVDGSVGFTYVGTGSGSVGSAANLKRYIDGNQFVVAKSYRFSSGHWAIIYRYDNGGSKLSDFKYLDPWDTKATIRTVSDGWVTATSATRIYR